MTFQEWLNKTKDEALDCYMINHQTERINYTIDNLQVQEDYTSHYNIFKKNFSTSVIVSLLFKLDDEYYSLIKKYNGELVKAFYSEEGFYHAMFYDNNDKINSLENCYNFIQEYTKIKDSKSKAVLDSFI